MLRILLASLAGAFLVTACGTTPAPVSYPERGAGRVEAPAAITSTASVSAEQGPFQPDVDLYLCPNSTITNAFAYDDNLRVIDFNPIVLVDGKVVLTPVPTNNACMTSGFGQRMGRAHNGIDFRSRPAGMVYSAAPGTIREAKRSPSFGNTILIDHGQGVFTRYAHLANIERGVEAGRVIGFGQPLGIMGTTGRSTGIHLHFEVLTGSYPSNLTPHNPLSFPPYSGMSAAY